MAFFDAFLPVFYLAQIIDFTLLCYPFIAEVGSMKRMWNIIDSFKVKRETKNRLFIWSQIMFYALAGAVVWVLLGRLVLPGIDWLLCFIGYPAIFIGFFGSVLFLYNNEFA